MRLVLLAYLFLSIICYGWACLAVHNLPLVEFTSKYSDLIWLLGPPGLLFLKGSALIYYASGSFLFITCGLISLRNKSVAMSILFGAFAVSIWTLFGSLAVGFFV